MKQERDYKKLFRELKSESSNPQASQLEILELKNKLRTMENENQDIRLFANDFVHKYRYSQVLLSKQQAQLQEFSAKILNLESELKANTMDYQIIKKSSAQKDLYIDFIEKVQTEFLFKIRQMQRNYPYLQYFQKDPVLTLDEMRSKVHVLFARQS